MKTFSFVLITCATPLAAVAQTQVIIETSLGSIPITLYDTAAPETVANFLGYINRGDYDDVIFHRLAGNFVLQTGGFVVSDPSSPQLVAPVNTGPTIVNEPGASNVRGTIAMAKIGGDPDSATSQWFVNLSDNSSVLDSQNGGFTVFGEVTDLSTVDEIAARPVATFAAPFNELPLLEYDPNEAVVREDLILITGVTVVPEPATGLLAGVALLGLLRRRR